MAKKRTPHKPRSLDCDPRSRQSTVGAFGYGLMLGLGCVAEFCAAFVSEPWTVKRPDRRNYSTWKKVGGSLTLAIVKENERIASAKPGKEPVVAFEGKGAKRLVTSRIQFAEQVKAAQLRAKQPADVGEEPPGAKYERISSGRGGNSGGTGVRTSSSISSLGRPPSTSRVTR